MALPAGSHSVIERGGIFGWGDMAIGLSRFLSRLAAAARTVDDGALAEMVSLAKSRVPVDTGRLLNGITGELHENFAVFRASAVDADDKKSTDYARIVEFGTAAGVRGVNNAIVAGEGFYSGDPFSPNHLQGRRAARARRAYRTHPGTPARPYFFNSANEVLASRELKMRDTFAKSASAEGFPLQ